jgi:hypothetical protein
MNWIGTEQELQQYIAKITQQNAKKLEQTLNYLGFQTPQNTKPAPSKPHD